MSVSQEVTIAFDQMAAASAVIDDDSISFTCRMWHIFLREIFWERDVFQSINAEILIGNNVIRSWYDQDGLPWSFPLAMREAFKWLMHPGICRSIAWTGSQSITAPP